MDVVSLEELLSAGTGMTKETPSRLAVPEVGQELAATLDVAKDPVAKLTVGCREAGLADRIDDRRRVAHRSAPC